MGVIRAYFRLVAFLIFVIMSLVEYMIPAVIWGRNLERGFKIRSRFANRVRFFLGVELEIKGKKYDQPAIYVCNHRTYYDPAAVLLDLVRVMIVAKAELSSWPLLGYAMDLTGIIFVKRESQDSRKATRGAMAEAVEQGLSILIYPEGTTGDRPISLDFRPGTFATAAKIGVPIVPLAIEYAEAGDAWVRPDQSFVNHFLQCYRKKKTRVKLRYGPPMMDEDVDKLRNTSKNWIDQNLLEMQAEFGGVPWPSTV